MSATLPQRLVVIEPTGSIPWKLNRKDSEDERLLLLALQQIPFDLGDINRNFLLIGSGDAP
jgi:hypothetical protein